MSYLNRNGTNIYFEATGAGPTILLSHGYSATSHMWRDQVAALSERYQVVVWDIRGHGRSDSPADPGLYSEAVTLADMAAILDQLQVESAAVGGLSLGGYLSLAFHVEHSSRVNKLLLFDTGPGYRKETAREEWNEMARGRGRFFRRRGLESIADESAAHGNQHRSAEGLALAAEGILQQYDARVIDSLPGISIPTLVLVGADDTPFLAASNYMAERIPGARKVILENAGHVANIDQPEPFNAALADFLGSTA
jgi:pimeloyl-ACP methyl ester carboxylesterase